MTPQEFCYWLPGRAELLPDQPPSADEWKMIREHLALAFVKVTPPKSPDQLYYDYAQLQRALQPKQPAPIHDPNRVTCSLPQQAYC